MAFKKIFDGCCADPDMFPCEFVLDSADDVANLPKCAPGSTAIVAAEGAPMFMVNASGQWEEL